MNERALTILVAEDDDFSAKLIAQQLSALGYGARVARTGIEALRLWGTGAFALILTDISMPDMDGYDLASSVRREEMALGRIPILALSAYDLSGETQRYQAAGIDECLLKPTDLASLKSALDRWLGPGRHP